MPPGASSFSASDNISQEVICPLHNQDGSNCRKRCLGEKRYRSMQEHIRRAHPEYYIPKLPATKDSFELMITAPPHERPAQDPNRPQQNNHIQQPQHSHHLSQPPPPQQQQQQPHHHHHHSDPTGLSPAFNYDAGLNSSFQGYHALGGHDGGYFTTGDTEATVIYDSMQAQQRSSDEYRRGSLIPAASAAAALAQLHYHRADSDWGGDAGQVILPFLQISPTVTEADLLQNYYADNNDLKPSHFHVDPALEESGFMAEHTGFPASSGQDQLSLQPSSLAKSPPDRPTTMMPSQRTLSRGGLLNRPRKSSISHQARIGKHERKKSKDLAKRHSGEKKLSGNEGSSASFLYGKRWEDLIDAAASATEEEGSRDLTPIPASPYQSPQAVPRTSLPPFALGSQFQSFQASPLTRALTPPSADAAGLDLQTFPSVDSSLSSTLSHHQHHSSAGSGSQFPIIDSSSPVFNSNNRNGEVRDVVQIYCAACRRASVLKDSFACNSCICGYCRECYEVLTANRNHMNVCPTCHSISVSFKPFRLELR